MSEQTSDAAKQAPARTKISDNPRGARFRDYIMSKRGQPGEPKWLGYRFLRFLACILVIPLFRVKATGEENIPDEPCILSPNHVSYLDSIVVMALTRRQNMPIRLLAKRELWDNKPLAWGIDNLGALPVSRESADLSTLRIASRMIKEGDYLGIFPEGTRVRTEAMKTDKKRGLGEASGGVAWLAIRNDATVVPVGLAGPEQIRPEGVKLFRLPRINVHYGTPIVPSIALPVSEYKKKERIEKLTELIMDGLVDALNVARAEKAKRDGKST